MQTTPTMQRVIEALAQQHGLTLNAWGVEELHYTGPLHPQARAILAIFEAAQGGPLTAAEVISALRRSGVPITAPTQVRVRLRRMAQRRQLRKVAHGTYETPR